MWPFNRRWPLNGGPLNRDSTVLVHVFQNYLNKFKYVSLQVNTITWNTKSKIFSQNRKVFTVLPFLFDS